MARKGVQVQEVFAAADALLAEGVRPTVEQVRVKLGSGSPNTIAPMLDSWFKGLGGRLMPPGSAMVDRAGPDVPDGVRQAVAALWAGALAAAKEVVDGEFSAARSSLAERQGKLDEERRALETQAQSLEASRSAMEESIQLAREQAADLRSQLIAAHAIVDQRDREVSELRARVATVERDVTDAHRRLQLAQEHARQQAEAQAEDRRRIEARAAAIEGRLVAELADARQQTSDALRAAEAADTKLTSARESMQAEIDRLVAKTIELQETLGQEREATGNIRQLAGVLQAKLDAEVDKRVDLGEQLAEARRVAEDLRRQLAGAVEELKVTARGGATGRGAKGKPQTDPPR